MWYVHTYPRWSTYLDAFNIKAVWPAFWTVGANWPTVRAFFFLEFCVLTCPLFQGGEIDILEGVHDNQHNQIAWHTSPGKLTSLLFFPSHFFIGQSGCEIDPDVLISGTINVCMI